jgi:uncharacterized protein (TIGR02996 family)
MDAEERGFLAAIKKNPDDATARSAYADWLDEHDRPYEAALQRSKAGLSEVFYKIRRKSDGLFSTAQRANSYSPMKWSATGKMWRKVGDLHSHMRNLSNTKTYAGTPWDDVEVVVTEVRVTFSTALPITVQQNLYRWIPTAVEPLAAGAGDEA